MKFLRKLARITKKVITFALAFEIYLIQQSGCSAVGSALRSGRRGRKFESCHPDKATIVFRLSLFLYP